MPLRQVYHNATASWQQPKLAPANGLHVPAHAILQLQLQPQVLRCQLLRLLLLARQLACLE